MSSITPLTGGIHGARSGVAATLSESFGGGSTSAVPIARIDAFISGSWVSLGPDVLGEAGIRAKRGMLSNGPIDRVATTGTLEFTLRNDARNSGATQGWYSPNHASCRSGWTFGIPVRLVIAYNGSDFTMWRGRIRTILPAPGKYREQTVAVTAQDCLGDLADTKVRNITPQVNQTEVQLLQAVIAAMPTEAQPPATSYDTALDTVPYAFDDIAGGEPAMQLAYDVVKSSLGRAYPLSDGTFRYSNRQTMAAKASSGTFTELMIHSENGLGVPSSLANVFNRVRATIHQKTVDAAAPTVLASLPVASAATPSTTSIAPGATITIWLNYFDPNNTEKQIGGTAQVTPIVATTDYLANTLADGSGTNLTANISVVTTAFASSVKFDITNNGATAAFITKLQIRGKGIYDNTPVTVETYTSKTYGDRLLEIDLKYQADASLAQEFTSYLQSLYLDLANQADYVRINPQASPTLLMHALQREITDVIGLSETVTGLNSVLLAILGVEIEIQKGSYFLCRWRVGPALTSSLWKLDDPIASVLDTSTVLGWA